MKKFSFKLSALKISFKKIIEIILLILPFILMDGFIRILAENVRYFHVGLILPNILFTVFWISLFVIASKCLKGAIGRIVYGLFFIIFFCTFVTQVIYYPYTEFFFGFNLLQSAEEGKDYIYEVVKNSGSFSVISCLLVFITGILAMVKYSNSGKTRWKTLVVFIAAFTIAHALIPTLFGSANKALEWDTWRNPRNVYESFSDRNKNMKICGLFEYSVRDLYVTFFRENDETDHGEVELAQEAYAEQTVHKKNTYTGKFEGKNVIFVQLEGIDSWLLTPQDTPNMYRMLKNSIVFNNHYSYYTGGGSTFNSELAVTTGFITPISYTKNPYSFTENAFPYSLPRMLKEKGYSVNAFHMNSGEFYTRDLNYKNWGYDDYYSLMEDGEYSDLSYQLDRELVLNEVFYDKLFKQEQPFMHYIITYTNHTPFSIKSETGKLLAKELYPEGEEIPEMGEEEVARMFAAETDKMMGLLLQGLEDNGLIENTVIVVYADHYLYTLNDKTILDKYKTTENNLINKTPFFIWSHSMPKRQIKKVNSQIDILPTVLNLMGVEYNDEWYIGRDIMDKSYVGYVFFSDYSWYDGVNYVENGTVVNNLQANQKYIMDTNDHINRLIQKNDLTLKYDIFKKKKTE